MIEDKLIEELLRLGNDEEFKKKCEPNVCWRMRLERWMVERVLEAIKEYNDKDMKRWRKC